MKITYEINPPKLVKGTFFDLERLNVDIDIMNSRALKVSNYVDGLHLTDSVLGIPRLSSIGAAGYLKKINNSLHLNCSIRVRDRNYNSLCQSVSDAILTGVDSLLILMGDKPAKVSGNSGLKPSTALSMLKQDQYSKHIKLNLSIPDSLDDKKLIESKIASRPNAFVTQSISSLDYLSKVVDLAKPNGIEVIACIMVPSIKNKFSSDMVGLNWSEYEKDPVDFILRVGKITNEILLTSPNSFDDGLELLKQLRPNTS
jgi:5,10-methylenetetrahydrofolate reductase